VGTAVSNDQHGFIRVPLVNSRLVLPDLRVTDSSEAMLSGRKPPLRLMMRAVYKDTLLPVPHIRHAISEGFVVAVRSSFVFLQHTTVHCLPCTGAKSHMHHLPSYPILADKSVPIHNQQHKTRCSA
jgi:hypothetical protein